jgi:hypothetical protein
MSSPPLKKERRRKNVTTETKPKDEDKESENKEPEDKETEGEKTPKRPPKKSTTPPADDDTKFPEIKIKEEIIADITPMGWILILGSVACGVALYIWIQRRTAQGKGVLPDKMQERLRPQVVDGQQ